MTSLLPTISLYVVVLPGLGLHTFSSHYCLSTYQTFLSVLILPFGLAQLRMCYKLINFHLQWREEDTGNFATCVILFLFEFVNCAVYCNILTSKSLFCFPQYVLCSFPFYGGFQLDLFSMMDIGGFFMYLMLKLQ